ncbi:MAG: hypothetical protein IJX17_04170 [Clostridia bacterium]|nr:hypothetical protein [Clostridia bacterium]
MSSRILFILKIVIIVILVAAVAGVGVFFGVKYFKNRDKDKEENPTPQTNPIISTNTYNEAISQNKFVTVNYSGTYKFNIVNKVVFNKKSETNPNGLTDEDIKNLYSKYVSENNYTEFCNYLYEKKKALSEASNEYITIVTPTDESTGKTKDFGIYTKSTKSSPTQTGKIYGDENLAVALIDGSTDYQFISLNYDNMADAMGVTQNKKTASNVIYVFHEMYSEHDPDLLLYTVTYEYKLVVEDNSIPSKDLIFDADKL